MYGCSSQDCESWCSGQNTIYAKSRRMFSSAKTWDQGCYLFQQAHWGRERRKTSQETRSWGEPVFATVDPPRILLLCHLLGALGTVEGKKMALEKRVVVGGMRCLHERFRRPCTSGHSAGQCQQNSRRAAQGMTAGDSSKLIIRETSEGKRKGKTDIRTSVLYATL